MASFSEWSNNKIRRATGAAKTTGTPQKVQSFSAWSDQKLGKVDTQKNPASGNTGFDRSGKTRDEYDSSVRQNYAARAAASDKLTESEYNRSTAMQQKYGSYQNYLVGATADGKYYSQPKLGADMERKYNTVTTYEANAKKKAEELQSANETAGNLYTKLNELSGKLPELQQYAGSSAIASGIVQQMQQEYASTLKQYEDATKAVDAAYAAYEPAWNRYKQAAEDYEAYRTEQQNLFDNWKKTIRTDENAINADLTAAQSNVKQLQEQQKTLQKQAQQLMNKVSSRRGGTNELMQWSQQAQALQAQAKAMDGKIAEAESAKTLLQEELSWADYYRYADLSADDKALGQYGKGNIDLHNRPQYKNPDGSISTVDSTSYSIDGKEVLLPTVWMKDGKPYHSHNDEEILQHYEETGEYLGKFNTPEDANAYGEQLHRAQDFYYGSQYKSTANGKKRSNLDVLFDNYSDDASGWDDPLYEYINGNSEAGAYITNQAGANYGGDSNPLGALFGMATENRSESQQMTDEEVAIFNYLYASQGKDAAHAYYDYLTGDLNYRQRQEEEAYWRDYAKESPVGSSVFSVLTSPMKGLSYLAQAADYLGTGSIDQNAAYNRFSYANNAIRNQVAETIEQSGNWGQAGSFLYQTGMSMGDFLLNTAITGGFGGGGALSEGMSLAIMGTGAAADATIAAKDRGLTDTQAFTLGTIAGAAEVFTEKFSIEALLKGKWEDGAIKYILKNAFTEGAEEVGSDFINLFADILIAKDKSEWQQTIDAYMAEGKTEGEAFGLAVAQQAAEMGLDFLGGALSGGTMATAGVGIGTVQRNAGYQQTGSTLRKMGNEMVNSIIETAETLDENSEAYKLGQELKNKLNKGKKLTDTEIGRLFAETTRMLEETEPTAGQTGTAQEQTKGVVLPTAEETGGTELPTAEQAETQTQQRTTEQERQTAPLRETMEADRLGVLPTAEQAETRQRAARAETETERTGILAGVDEDTVAKVQRIANIVGREVIFFDEGADSAGGMHNGYYNPADGKIYVNARSQNPVAQIISHELTHSIEASGSYSDLQKLVLNRIRQTGGDLQAMRQQKAELYARHGENLTDNAAIDSEIVAEYVEKYLLTDEQSIRTMVQQNRTLGQRILQFINELLAKLGNSDAQERAFLTKAKNYYQSALQETQSSFTADMQQRAAAQAQNMNTLQQQMANGEISEEDAEAAFNDMYDPEIDMQQGLGGLQHSYAGANANGANLESLREAQEMQQAGADMESIRKATGWHQFADGKWRFEIDDSRMQLRTDAADIPNYTTLGELVDAPELFEAYPDMADLSVTFHTLEDGQNGGYSRKFDSIELSRDLKNRPEALLNSIIHEAQHAIQNREGFASGANPAYWNRRMENGFDSRTAEERREGARLQEQYEQIRESDPQFVAAMEELAAMAPKVPRGKVDLNTWEQIEPDPPEWVRYDERRDQLEEQYGDRVWDWYSLRDSIDRNARNGGRMPTDLYRDTAGEIEARDTAKRRELTAQERRETSPDYGSEDTVFADSGDGYAIGKTTDNKPFVEVEQDILAGVPEADWVKTVKENLKKKFPNGITVGNNEIQIDGRSRQEMTFSRYMQWLYNNDPQLHADKLRATDNADEILRATTDWVNEGLNHPRKDRITDFARGNVLLRVGGNDYTADVVVGTKKNGSMALYDVLNLQPTSFTEKEADAAISTNPSPGAARSTASVSDDSVAEKLPPVKKRFSIDEPVERTKDLIAVHNKDWSVIRDAALNWGGIPSPSVAIVDAAEGHTKYGDTSVVFPRATIDPEADPRNKVYGGDAWTPTKDNALVEREVNYEARRAFDENIKNLSSQFAGGVFQGSGTLGKIGLENETRWEPEEIADKLANHPEVQAAFLQSEGKSLEPVYRDKQFDRFFSNATIRRYLDTVGEQEVARLAVKLMTGERLTAEEMKPAEQAIRDVYAEEHANFLNRRPESKEKRIDYYMKNNVFPNQVEDFIRSTQEFYESGGSAGEIDKEATAAKMMEMIAPGGSWNDALRTVKDWVQPQLEGLLGERGIYNGQDAVTDSGRRSFAQTHWDYTAENIVKAMNMAAAKGANMHGVTPETLAATATREYRNVDEMHADEARLRTVSEEEHEKALRDLGIYLDRVVNDLMLTTMHKYDNSFEEEQNLSGIIAEAAKGKKTVAAVKAAFRKEGYAISDGHAKSILALIDRAANIPTGYYEAKAQRVVPFSEAAAIIAPTSAPAEEIAAVKAATGVNIIQYETGNDEQRRELVNGLEGVKFSISEDSDGRQLTEAQQEFFKDSKAVDGKGRLLTLYHGTGTKFTVFDKAHIGENFADRGSDLGFYFSPYIEDATGYAREATGYKGKGEIMQVYLNLKNPLVIEDEGWGSAIGQADIRHGDLKRWAQEGGHDGIIVKSTDIEMDDNGTPDAVYIAFSPEQIKSVTNENPTDNPDIRFSISEGGEYDGAVKLKESTIDTYLRDYAAKSSPKYAKAYIAYMTPDDFLNLTTSESGRQIVEQHSKTLDAEKLGEATRWQPIQLNIDHETGEVLGHEGRHRAVAMRNAGVEQIPVLLFDSSNKYSKSEIGELTLTGQDFGGTWSDAEVRVHNLLPLSYENRDAVVERFTMPTDERTLQYSVTEGETTEATLPTAEDEEKKNSIRTSLPKKAQDYLKRAENALVGRVSRALSVPHFAQREYLQKIAQQISEEYLTTGRVSEETAAELFERAYSEGIVVDEEFYQQYKDIKDHLRTQAVTISEEDKHDIADFNDFRKSAFGRLRIVNEGGLPVDVAYQELQDMAPELFPDDLTHPADQLVRMFEVAQSIEKTEKSLSEYYGRDAEEFKRWAKNDFDAAIGDTIGDLRTVKRYADERAVKANAAAETPMTTEQVTEAYKQLKKARWESEKAKAKNLLTDHDNVQLGRLLKGEIELEHLDPKTDNVKGITAVYEATTEYERLVKLLTEYKQSQRAKLREEADKFLETANDWKDKKAGILYSRETMERNILDIVKDKKLAQEIIAEYFTPVHEAQAKSTRLKNKMRERVRALNLSTKETKAMQKEGKISEAHAVQLLGEAMDNIRMLENSRGRMAERDGKTLSDWRSIVQNMWAQNPQLDKAKIEHAVEEFRSIYDELFQQMNEARVRNGYEPVNYRSGYFPHFQPGDGDGIMGLFGRALGIDTQVTALPTTINGLTHTFRPGIQWFGNAQQRLGFDTAYDAVEGFDRYIEGVADVIYQTDNIQKLRALATQARYRTGDEGIRKQVDTVYADTRLTEEEKRSKIDSIYEDGRFALSNFVVELEEYTNLLANKKSRADRNMEQALGRNMYNLVKGLESRVAANMVAINPASWLTNFIPLTQGGAMLDRGELLRGMWQTLQSFKENDGIVDASAFLTNRKGSDPLVRTWAQKASATMSSPMEYIDQFTAGSLVRARYNQNLKRGMSETAAMTEADNWTAGVMADRSKGSTPTLFNRSNPLTKVFTQFQLEVNNQLSYLFKDMPRAYKEKGLAALAMALFKFFLGAWLYDEVYEYFIGRRPALDPLGILNDTVGDITGYELPNLVELGVGAATGDMPSFETEKKNAYDTVTETLGDVAEELPFIGGVLGGGRVPISSALPDWDNLLKTVTSDTWSTKKKLATAGKELMNPLTYLALPFGGGQLKKIYQGLSATIKGGSYSVDAEGNDLLQYPVYNDDPWQAALNAGQAMLFGKTSLKTGRDWVESGFKSFGAKETAAYQGMTEAGVPEEDAYNLLKELRGTKKTETESKAEAERRVLQAADISGDGKSVAYYGLMATDKERELMDALADSDADMGAVTQVLLDVKNAGSLKGAEASNAKRTALAESPLTDDEKREMYRYLFGEKQEDGSYTTSRDDDIMAFEQAGLGFDTFLKVQNEYTTVNEKYSGASEKAVEFSRWVNSQNLAAEQAETVRDCFKYYSQIPAEAARYDSFVSAGLSDDAAYELANSLNALEPEDGKDSVSGLQRYRAVVDAGLSTEEQMSVLGEMMQESEYSKLQTGYSYGVTPEAYVSFRELLPKFDFDGNGTFKQEEVEAAIDSMGGGGNGIVLPGAGDGQSLTVTQQAALWQLANKSWKPAKNPYSTSVGQKVYDALNAETESGIVLPDGTSYTGGLVLPKG